MNWISKVSERLAEVVRRNTPEMTDEEYESISYGLYMLISDSIKLWVTIIFALVLGIFLYTIVTILSFGVIRCFIGGVHAKTWWGCLGVNLSLFLGLPSLALYFSGASIWPISVVGFLVTAVIIHLYAPADHENKPVIGERRRKRLKGMAYLVLTLMFITATVLVRQPFSNIIMFSALVEALLILPVAYKVTRTKYGDAYQR